MSVIYSNILKSDADLILLLAGHRYHGKKMVLDGKLLAMSRKHRELPRVLYNRVDGKSYWGLYVPDSSPGRIHGLIQKPVNDETVTRLLDYLSQNTDLSVAIEFSSKLYGVLPDNAQLYHDSSATVIESSPDAWVLPLMDNASVNDVLVSRGWSCDEIKTAIDKLYSGQDVVLRHEKIAVSLAIDSFLQCLQKGREIDECAKSAYLQGRSRMSCTVRL